MSAKGALPGYFQGSHFHWNGRISRFKLSVPGARNYGKAEFRFRTTGRSATGRFLFSPISVGRPEMLKESPGFAQTPLGNRQALPHFGHGTLSTQRPENMNWCRNKKFRDEERVLLLWLLWILFFSYSVSYSFSRLRSYVFALLFLCAFAGTFSTFPFARVCSFYQTNQIWNQTNFTDRGKTCLDRLRCRG